MISNMIPVLVVGSVLALLVYTVVGTAIGTVVSIRVPCGDHVNANHQRTGVPKVGCSADCANERCRDMTYHGRRCPTKITGKVIAAVLWPLLIPAAICWFAVKTISPMVVSIALFPVKVGNSIGKSLSHQEETA